MINYICRANCLERITSIGRVAQGVRVVRSSIKQPVGPSSQPLSRSHFYIIHKSYSTNSNSTMASQKTILVTGATGKQGGAVIQRLLESEAGNAFKIIAVTRKTDSAGAKKLASKPNVSLLQGDFGDSEAIFKKAGKVWGAFSVQPMGKEEEVQGKAFVDAAVNNGVEFLVYTSVDRGGKERSDKDPTNVPHL